MGVVEEISRMQKEGKSEQEIVQTLVTQGYPQNQVSDALSQTRIKEAVNTPTSEIPTEQYTVSESQAPSTPATQSYPSYPSQEQYTSPAPGQYDYSGSQPTQGQGYYQDYYQPQSGMSSDTMSEIAEQVMADRFSSIKTELEKVIDFRNTVSSRIDIIDERLRRIEKIIDRLQLSILQKVGDYLTNVDEIKKELGETQKSFKSLLNKSGSGFSTTTSPSFSKPE